MHGTITTGEQTTDASERSVAEAMEGPFFWLDLDDGGNPATTALLRDRFGFHPLAVEDADHFGQRPKIDDYDDFTYLVVHGARGDDPRDGNGPGTRGPTSTPAGSGADSGRGDESPTVEVHCFVSERFVVTVRRDPCHALDQVRELVTRRRTSTIGPPQVALVYLIIDQIVDSFFPVLASFDDRIDELEDDILTRPTDAQLGTLFSMKRRLIGLRKVVTPQRDMFSGVLAGTRRLPGMTEEAERYFRDLYDHLIRISDLVDSYRDLLSSALDTHLSTVSNRLNVVMKQLTIIATVFLPLTFLTGFFGQNFQWPIARIGGLAAWLVLGVGLEVVSVVVLLVFFRRRGWFGGGSI